MVVVEVLHSSAGTDALEVLLGLQASILTSTRVSGRVAATAAQATCPWIQMNRDLEVRLESRAIPTTDFEELI